MVLLDGRFECLLIHFCVRGQLFGPERPRKGPRTRATAVEVAVEVT